MNKSQISLDNLSDNEVLNRLFEGVAIWIKNGHENDLRFNGTKTQIQVLKDAMLASKNFHYEVSKKNSTLSSINESLKLKHAAANQFQSTFGIVWPL